MGKSESDIEEKEEKAFGFYLEILITCFVSFFAVYPVLLDLLDRRQNAFDAAILSMVFAIIVFTLILFAAYYFAKTRK